MQSTLRLLHDGRFDEADQQAADLAARVPEAPGPRFLQAFVSWWRLLYDDENRTLASQFEERLSRSAAAGDAAVRSREATVEATVWGGYSHLLLAQLRATQGRSLAAAREAREARRLLGRAHERAPESPEPQFGLGTYNYYADRVSAVAKGIRFLLGLPAGDRESGLSQLDVAARRSRYFALESRLLLVTIFSGRHERKFTRALQESTRALALHPESIAVLDAAARLDVSLGSADRAALRLDRALAIAGRAPRTDPSVLAGLRLQRARAEFSRFRPDLALEWLQPLLAGNGAASPARTRREAEALAAAAARLTGESPSATREVAATGTGSAGLSRAAWARLREALQIERTDGIPSALRSWGRLAEETPEDPALCLLFGRSLLLSGHGAEASRWVQRTDGCRDLPDEWIGPCRLLEGRAADLSGERSKAVESYRKALKAPPFLESSAVYLHLETPFPAVP